MAYRIPRLPKPENAHWYSKSEIDNYLKLVAATMQRDIFKLEREINLQSGYGNYRAIVLLKKYKQMIEVK